MHYYYSANAEASWWSEQRADAERQYRREHGERMDDDARHGRR